MIIDSVHNAGNYFHLHPLFEKAFSFIKDTDLAGAAEGKSEVTEGIKAIISNGPGKSKEASSSKFECHDLFIDIQYCISGRETIGWKPRETCKIPNGDYNAEKDVRFFSDEPDTFFDLTDGQFALFFPGDVHAPMIGEGIIKKLVLKVKI